MRNLNQDNITQAVIASVVQTDDTRLKEIMTSLVHHLHPEHLRVKDELVGIRIERHQVDYEVAEGSCS